MKKTKQCRFGFLGTPEFLSDLKKILDRNGAVTSSGYFAPRKGTQFIAWHTVEMGSLPVFEIGFIKMLQSI